MMMEEIDSLVDWERLSELLPDEDIYIPASSSIYDGGDGIFGQRTLEKLYLSPTKESSAWSPPFDSPTSPYRYTEFGLTIDVDDFQNIEDTTSDVMDEDPKMLPFHKRFEATAYSLVASMKRSQETRRFLTIMTPKTEDYPRRDSIKGVIESVQKSTEQLQSYLPKEEPMENDGAQA
jgi:hypothetical protein